MRGQANYKTNFRQICWQLAEPWSSAGIAIVTKFIDTEASSAHPEHESDGTLTQMEGLQRMRLGQAVPPPVKVELSRSLAGLHATALKLDS